MKAVLETLQTEKSNSIIVRKIELENFDALFHFHPAFELTLILAGKGQRYIGKQVHEFLDGDLVFVGANLPHCWINQPSEGHQVAAIVIQFDDAFLGALLHLPEMHRIKEFIKKSTSGFEITGETKKKITEKIKQLAEKSSLLKITSLVEILDVLSQSKELAEVDPSFFDQSYNLSETARFQKVFSYLIENFRETIALNEIAQVAGLSPTSFCRYFKSITQKSFIEVMLEYRIQNACQLLHHKELPIRHIAFESGFRDVPYFNKAFKKIKGINPKQFRSIIGYQ